MHGARRVICFCFLTAVLPTILVIIPLYLRHSVYADVTYAVAESDVLEMVNGISSIFCQAHSLKMNSSFSAFQVSGEPEISTTNRKHIRLKKSMSLPDDTLEYWGFFLPRGSTVHLSVCSRFDGSRILVVQGEKHLRSCGLQGEADQPGHPATHMAQGAGNVKVTFETVQEIPPANIGGETNSQVDEDVEEFEGESDNELDDYEDDDDDSEVDDEDDVTESTSSTSSTTTPEPTTTSTTTTSTTTAITEVVDVKTKNSTNHKRHHRHEKKKHKHIKEQVNGSEADKTQLLKRKKRLQQNLLYSQDEPNQNKGGNGRLIRRRRVANAIPKHKLDGGMVHGGNARNYTERDNDSSVSSFENSLLTCYDRHILLTKGFPPSLLCTNVTYLETSSYHMQTTHEVVSDGYYYYIFYSDNDNVMNDIHAVFDIHKPTYQFGNYTKGCINQTECTFPISFMSDDTVVVEVPTRDGIEHEADDITLLQSTCHPRMAIYAFFPIAVLFLILGCAFL